MEDCPCSADTACEADFVCADGCHCTLAPLTNDVLGFTPDDATLSVDATTILRRHALHYLDASASRYRPPRLRVTCAPDEQTTARRDAIVGALITFGVSPADLYVTLGAPPDAAPAANTCALTWVRPQRW